ncbi:MAG: mechanosensitive ion channel [Lachnospiraceae bacterium]|nr:mechanosensitive ion channel [Lachnospiraceae bacterium]
MQEFLNFLTQLGTEVGLKILYGLLVLFVGLKLSKYVVKLVSKGKAFGKLELSVQHFLQSLIKILLYAAVIASACLIWGIPATAFVTIFASAGLAIGMALQGTLSNFAGGLMILIFKPFKIGDYIENGAAAGVVTDITIIYTIITTVDNKVITIPNSALSNSNITNYSTSPIRRVDITVSAAYTDDIEKVKQVLLDVADKNEKILKDPAPFARLVQQNTSSLDYTFRCWCNGADYWDVFFDMTEASKKAFTANGLSVPYPQMDVHMK